MAVLLEHMSWLLDMMCKHAEGGDFLSAGRIQTLSEALLTKLDPSRDLNPSKGNSTIDAITPPVLRTYYEGQLHSILDNWRDHVSMEEHSLISALRCHLDTMVEKMRTHVDAGAYMSAGDQQKQIELFLDRPLDRVSYERIDELDSLLHSCVDERIKHNANAVREMSKGPSSSPIHT